MAIILGAPYTPNFSTFSTPTNSAASAGSGVAGFGMWTQLAGVLASAYGARVNAKIERNNLRFQGDMSMLNARSAAAMGSINANYTAKATLLGASYAEAMARVQSQGVRRLSEIQAQTIKQTAEANAQIAEMGAQSVLSQGQQQTAALTLKAGQMKSTQRAAMAANGIDLGEGNAVDVQASTDLMKEIDKNQIEANAIRSAWGYRTQGVATIIEGNTRASQVMIDGQSQAVQIQIKGANEAAGIRAQGAADLFQIQTQAARDEFGYRWSGNSSYAASNAISPDRSFAQTLATGAMGVADTWYRWSKVK